MTAGTIGSPVKLIASQDDLKVGQAKIAGTLGQHTEILRLMPSSAASGDDRTEAG